MHTCEPPFATLDAWLKSYPSVGGNYGHLLLEQKIAFSPELVDNLRPYFESAHLDAREYFHAQIAIDLHPDADAPGAHACYPNCLPPTTRHGLFGEVMAGLLTEVYQKDFVGGHIWTVPIFLFRFHADVESYLWTLARDADRTRQIFGRFGSDFIGLSLDDYGTVVRLIAGEAKWRDRLTQSSVDTMMLGAYEEDEGGERVRNGRGVWFEINRDTPVPHGLRQLQRLLELRAPDDYSAAILSIDRAIALNGPPLPRTNLILISGNGRVGREEGDSMIPSTKRPEDYAAPHDLQVIELVLDKGTDLIEQIYSSLWQAPIDA
ncbi:MAG: aminotransferase [Ferrovibrionaceae bacterium]